MLQAQSISAVRLFRPFCLCLANARSYLSIGLSFLPPSGGFYSFESYSLHRLIKLLFKQFAEFFPRNLFLSDPYPIYLDHAYYFQFLHLHHLSAFYEALVVLVTLLSPNSIHPFFLVKISHPLYTLGTGCCSSRVLMKG